jgi:hypothetical protein
MSDVIVVGSGASGVHAAAPLLDAGLDVLLLDFGNTDQHYAPLIPPKPFFELRRTDPEQHRYFLGDHFEGVPFGPVRVGAQLTPPRLFISRDSRTHMPVRSDTFSATESLALGGLAAGWGAGVFPFSDAELDPLTRAELEPHYRAVADLIGVSGARDDLLPVFGDLPGLMPPLAVDTNSACVLARYERRRAAFNSAGFALGKTRLAVSTEAHRGRGPHGYLDMDFWSDADRSVYRPRWTLEELRTNPRLVYLDRRLVEAFIEHENEVVVRARDTARDQVETHRARALILAAGTFSTARIVLRSLERWDARVPVLCNPYSYVPVLNLGAIGKPQTERRHSLAQLTAIYQPPDHSGLVQTQLYSYRSLLNFKLIKEAPLGHREAIELFRVLTPLLGILGISHDDRPGPTKFGCLERGGEGRADRFEIEYRPTDEEQSRHRRHEAAVTSFFRRLGCVPLRLIRPGHGSSIHYAGTFPLSTSNRPLTTDRDGLLAGTRRVHIADGSVLRYLPAKGLTFTLMANARRIGANLAARLLS